MKRLAALVAVALTAHILPGAGDAGAARQSDAGAPAEASGAVRRARPMGSAGSEWRKAPFHVVQTELSPATLFHCEADRLTFFANMPDYGLGAPTRVAYATEKGVQVGPAGTALDPAAMTENWVLVWFAGAKGWDHWDTPWAVYLQHRPRAMSLTDAGLAFEFPKSAGDVVLMPLYGLYKLPQPGKPDMRAALGLPARVTTPEVVVTRVRYWSRVLREFPLYCEDSFSVDRAAGTVTLRQRFHWLSITDDWGTPHLKLAPLSPPLAHAIQIGGFPARLGGKLSDPGLFTPYGPYLGYEGADSYDVAFPVLKYINEMEASDPPALDAHPTVQAALDRLRAAARAKFPSADRYEYDHGGLGNFCWAIMGDLWYAKGLPYYDEETRAKAVASLRRYFREDVLVRERFVEREYPKGSGRTYLILEGPGIGSWGVLGDAGKFSSNLLETLWAYAQYTGDWDLIKERWPLIKRLFCTPAEARWVTFAREAIAEIGDEAAPCLAMARMAYKVGDLDTYGYAACMFTRELAHLYLKQRGAAYFRQNQPLHSLEPLPEEVYLTNLWGETAGWQIDGPTYPEKTGERQYNNRWVRFKNEDVGRFYRDFLAEDVRKELDLLQGRWDEKRRYTNDSHIMPSLVQLRSLLLNEGPAELAKVATPDQFQGPASGVIASCLSVLRTSRPTRWRRVVEPGPATPFVPGLERDVPGPSTDLAQSVRFAEEARDGKPGAPTWPHVTWWGWKTPTGHRWSFGHVIPGEGAKPSKPQLLPINWNTQVVTYAIEK